MAQKCGESRHRMRSAVLSGEFRTLSGEFRTLCVSNSCGNATCQMYEKIIWSEFRHTMGFFLITHKFVPQLETEWMERKVECTENYRKNMSQTNSIAIKKYFSNALIYEDPIEGQNNLFMRLSL